MILHPLAAGAVALAGNLVLSLGMTFQKKNVRWIGYKGERDAGFRRARRGWLLGFALTNLQPIFNYIALGSLPPNLVGVAAGSSVAFTALLASSLLGERLGRRRLAWTVLMFAAMGLAGLLSDESERAFVPAALYAFIALPLAAAALAYPIMRRSRGKRVAVLVAAVSGVFGGFMVLPMRVLQITAGGNPALWLSAPWLYLYLVAGVCGIVLLQLAFKHGELASLSPAYYGMQVLTPAVASYFAFGTRFDPLQAAAFVVIAACVAMISREPSPGP